MLPWALQQKVLSCVLASARLAYNCTVVLKSISWRSLSPVSVPVSAERGSCDAGRGDWTGVNGENSTGDGWVSVSQEPFYERAAEKSEFTIINGVYQPIISMTVTAASQPGCFCRKWRTACFRTVSMTWPTAAACDIMLGSSKTGAAVSGDISFAVAVPPGPNRSHYAAGASHLTCRVMIH